jgi:argininosuccinate lyase
MAKPKAKKAKPKPTWAGRLPGGLAPEAWSFLHSLPHDRFLWPYDIDGTRAHVSALVDAKILTAPEGKKLRKELLSMKDQPALIEDSDEDVHSAIERVLTERLGDLGAKVHAGRSRNDQVATAMRLWTRERLSELESALSGLIKMLADRADQTADVLAPGYTHLQRAQPITVGHWLCAHAWSLVRDMERVRAAQQTTDVSPLGAGALAGTTLGIDPAVAQKELKFARVFDNSIDAVSDRDFLVDGAYACAMTLTHLSRLAEEIVLWSSAEFSFITLPDKWATGSSMMPQKKNPDVAELARGTTGLAVGALTGLLVTLKSLPMAYDRDLQSDKQHVQGVFEATTGALTAMTGLVKEMKFNTKALSNAVSSELLATDRAEFLVQSGVPFRHAHEQVAKSPEVDGGSGEARQAKTSVSLRGKGGPGSESVKKQAAALLKAARTQT